jgi:two-component system, NarL family, response regulator NreC
MPKTRIVLADDHAMLRAGLAVLLNGQADLEVVGEAGDGAEAIKRAQELEPDVLVADITMPGMSGLEAIAQVTARSPRVKCIVLTQHEDEDFLFQALRVGASGYVVKREAHTELIEAIRTVSRGDAYLNPAAVKRLLKEYAAPQKGGYERGEADDPLTVRQREVLGLIVRGYTNQEIAKRLVVSVKTVEKHKAEVMQKLGLTSRAALVSYALQKGLLTIDT